MYAPTVFCEMDELLLGLCGLMFSLLVTGLMATRVPQIAHILMVAFGVRAVLAVLHTYGLIALPGGGADAVRFERYARRLHELSWPDLYTHLDIGTSYVWAWMGGVLYKVLGASPLLWVSINVLLGTVAVALTYVLVSRVTTGKRAFLLTWIAALFPTLVIHSAVLLREMVIIVPFTCGILMTMTWVQNRRTGALVLAVISFGVAAVFHGGVAVAILGLWLVMARELVHGARRSPWGTGRVSKGLVGGVIGSVLVGLVVLFAVASEVRLTGLGQVDERLFAVGDTIEERFERDARGGSAYPGVLATGNPWSAPWIIPGRVVYFLFSPFPWDIRAISHLQGLVPAGIFLFMALSIWKSRKLISERRDLQAIALILALCIFTFSMGATNIGTSIRHRTKFVHALLVLCLVPVFRRLNFYNR